MNPYRYDIQTLERKARAVRRHIVRLNANSPAGGHTGADLSQVELLTALYFRVLNVAPDRLDDPQRDIYIQSKGHAVGCYYCVLAEPASSRSSGWRPTSMPIPISPATRCGRKRRASSSTPARWATVCLLRWGWRWPRRKATAPAAFF